MTFDLPYTKVLRNSAKCRVCEDEIESKHRHNFVSCKCGEIFIDGGREPYSRAGAKDFANFINTSESRLWTDEEYREQIRMNQERLNDPYLGEYMKSYYMDEIKAIEEFLDTLK